ncbi:hypothetical protein C1646_748704 [Rhizophagus diaphanus]|nr:hypothetical protein C1646_748704 [Rhizophagus diaphanus] [Rhizophagus sp. MUCL 43196]
MLYNHKMMQQDLKPFIPLCQPECYRDLQKSAPSKHPDGYRVLQSCHNVIEAYKGLTSAAAPEPPDLTYLSLEELSQYAPEILELLTTGVPKVDKEKRHQARDRLQKEYKFSKEQAYALIPHERIGWYISQVPVLEELELEAKVNISIIYENIPEGETIRETAQRIVQDNLSERDVKAISRTLVETASDPVVVSSCLSRLRRELRTLNASEKIISATKIPEITRASNKIQQERTEQCKNEGLYYPDHFLLELVKERLDLYDVSNTPDKQALADVMIMLYIHPAEIKNLRIANRGVTGYTKI